MNTNETVLEEAGAPRANNEASALSVQVGGAHYRWGGIQPVQYIEANELGFLEGCVVKRVTRHNLDGGKGRQDIEKAIHELQLLLELRYVPKTDDAPPAEGVEAQREQLTVPTPGSPKVTASEAINMFLQDGCAEGTYRDRWIRLEKFFQQYDALGQWIVQEGDEAAFISSLAEAELLEKRGCTNITMRYDPDDLPENNGIYLTWVDPQTDSPNGKTDLQNPKCRATEVECGANFSGIENFGGPPPEPKSEATVDAPSRETSTMRVSMPWVVPVTLRERYRGKHPALGAAYRKAAGATSQDLFGSLIRGAEYMHPKHGRCIFIGNHPHDGALVIMEAYDEDVDEHYMFGCEHRELSAVVPQTDSATPERLVDEPKSEAIADVVKFVKDLAAAIPPGALGQPYQRIADDLKNVKFQPFYPRQRAGTTRIEFVDRAAFEALLPALRPGDRVRFGDNGYARSSLRSGKTGTIIEQLTPGVFMVRPDDEPKDSQGWMFEEAELVFVARGEG